MSLPLVPVINPIPKVYDGTIELFWESEGDSSITNYIITEGANQYVIGSNVFTHTFSNLTNGTSYQFVIQGSNAEGVGPANFFRPVQPGFPPDPPTISTIQQINTNVYEIGWVNASNLGFSSKLYRTHVTAYPVDASDLILPSSNLWIHRSTFDGLPNEYQVCEVPLTSNYPYCISLQSINDCGWSSEVFSSTIQTSMQG